jgi:hypothetical protein
MLPTLLGRWQTRILLFVWIGMPISVVFGIYLANAFRSPRVMPLFGTEIDPLPVQIMCCVTLIGLLLDPLYVQIQRLRWEHDWPFAFQAVSMISEFLITLGLLQANVLPYVSSGDVRNGDYIKLVIHFAIVFSVSFVALLAILQIFLLRWRFNGGEWSRL